ncbi:MAG: hypothetical protein ABI760_18085 [Ferruginibacter sp.]
MRKVRMQRDPRHGPRGPHEFHPWVFKFKHGGVSPGKSFGIDALSNGRGGLFSFLSMFRRASPYAIVFRPYRAALYN